MFNTKSIGWILVLVGIVTWAISYVIRRKNYQAGTKLAWIACAILVIAGILIFTF
ncbi:MAG: hypothetical protein IKQ46_00995 [Bacteroidales bacterium]|jgi:hypothetical protein|nr:hypothetical protein [Bacteroidales bacterium]